MVNCGDKKCQQRADDTHTEVFKENGLKERIVSVERRKIPWLSLTWIVPLFLIIIGGIGGILYAKGEKNGDKNQEISTRVTRLEERYAAIDRNTAKTLEILEGLVKEKNEKSKDDKPENIEK